MKKIIGLSALAVAFIITSCSNEPAETKKEVIVVPAPEKKQPVVIKEEPKPTSISLDKNGVKVESKKVKVDIKPN